MRPRLRRWGIQSALPDRRAALYSTSLEVAVLKLGRADCKERQREESSKAEALGFAPLNVSPINLCLNDKRDEIGSDSDEFPKLFVPRDGILPKFSLQEVKPKLTGIRLSLRREKR